MKHPLAYLIACTTLVAVAASAHAEVTVFVKPQAAYVEGAGVMPKIKEECGLEVS